MIMLAVCLSLFGSHRFTAEFKHLNERLLAGEIGAEAEVMLALNSEVQVPASLSLTSKGNGTIDVLGLRIRIYDAHEDWVTYQGGLLDFDNKDVNSDGFQDLIFSGVANIFDDKGVFIRHEAIVMIFVYAPQQKTFERAYIKLPEELSIEIVVRRLP